MNENKHSLDLSGLGTCSGGVFNKVDISGKGKVNGNIKCSKFDASGMATVNGDITCDSFSTSGMSKVKGSIDGKEIEVSGTLTVDNNTTTDLLDVSGMVKINGNVRANEVKCEGFLKVGEGIECENIDIYGVLDSKGLINCESINIILSAECNCSEIGATSIVIESDDSPTSIFNFLAPRKFRRKRLYASLIEGDDIKLENCEAKVVRGRNIKIGANCKIDVIEYSESIDVDSNSKVIETNKI